MYTLGRKSSLSSENLSCSTTDSTPRFNVALYNFPLPPHYQRPLGPQSIIPPQLNQGRRVKIHHAFETVVEVPEELEFDATIAGPEEEVPRVKQIVVEIMQYLSTEGINGGSIGRLSINRAAPPEPEAPRPMKPPPRPPTPYPHPPPGSTNNMIEARRPKPTPRPFPGPPGPPPPYPPPPIPQAHGKSHRGAELFSINGDIRLRMVRVARPAPPTTLPKNHTPLKLSLEDQRWGVVVPRIAGPTRSSPRIMEGYGDEALFKYDPEERIWCEISPISRQSSDNAPSTAASSEAYCEKQQPISPRSSIPRYFQDPLNNTIHTLNSVPEPGFPSRWEFSPKLDSANPEAHYIIAADKKPTVRDFFAHSKMSFSKLKSVASIGSLKKAAISGGEERSHAGRISSTSVSSTSSYSTTSTTTSQRKQKGMEADGNNASISYICIGSAKAGFNSLYTTTSFTIKPACPFSVCASTVSTNSSYSQQNLGEIMSSVGSSQTGASTGVIRLQPRPSSNLREVPSEEFLKVVQLRKEIAKQNIIALEEKAKKAGKTNA
ncbi:hypothetical protein BGX38DRAFT_1265029 [Terfezia claveryi]|nr:hypothetical protein BGX38DRAFT_1265029 [Terfezia claveryi]